MMSGAVKWGHYPPSPISQLVYSFATHRLALYTVHTALPHHHRNHYPPTIHHHNHHQQLLMISTVHATALHANKMYNLL